MPTSGRREAADYVDGVAELRQCAPQSAAAGALVMELGYQAPEVRGTIPLEAETAGGPHHCTASRVRGAVSLGKGST
jgi:hypothetical protein